MPTNDDHDVSFDDVRLGRYVAGESTPAERAEIDAWVAADPARRELLDSLATAWETSGRAARHQTSNVNAAWSKMSASIDHAERPRPIWTQPAWRIAAAVLVVAGGIGVWRLAPRSTPIVPASPAVEYATSFGAREAIGIADGSRVVLGPASRLTVAANYGQSSRDVTLVGEALFTVEHDATKPFRVHITGAVIEDLGTEFGVRAYAEGDTVRVVVTSGVVMLRRSTTSSDTLGIINAGEVGLLPATGDAIVARVSNASALLAWSNGQLAFDDTPMSRVAEELRRWYDVDVVVDRTLLARHVTADFSGESIDDVARVIAATIGGRVERDGRTVMFRAAGPSK